MKRRGESRSPGSGLRARRHWQHRALRSRCREIKWRLTSSCPKSLDTIHGGSEMSLRRSAKRPTTSSRSRLSRPAKSCRACRCSTRAERHRRDGAHRVLLLCRQGSDLRVRLRDSVGPNTRINRLEHDRRREELITSSTRSTITSLLAGNTSCQMGGWFRKEMNSVEDLPGLNIPHRWLCRRGSSKLGLVPQQTAAATSIRRWKKAPSTQPSGSVPMTTRS